VHDLLAQVIEEGRELAIESGMRKRGGKTRVAQLSRDQLDVCRRVAPTLVAEDRQ